MIRLCPTVREDCRFCRRVHYITVSNDNAWEGSCAGNPDETAQRTFISIRSHASLTPWHPVSASPIWPQRQQPLAYSGLGMHPITLQFSVLKAPLIAQENLHSSFVSFSLRDLRSYDMPLFCGSQQDSQMTLPLKPMTRCFLLSYILTLLLFQQQSFIFLLCYTTFVKQKMDTNQTRRGVPKTFVRLCMSMSPSCDLKAPPPRS